MGSFEGAPDAAAEEAEVEVELVVSKNGGLRLKASDVEEAKVLEAEAQVAKRDEGNILEAESFLREDLSLNYEEARALLGRLEYQRGNVEAALRVFEGIDLHAAIQRLQSSLADSLKAAPASRRGRKGSDPANSSSVSQHAASLVLEAIYLKAMSFQKLGKPTDAAQECKSVLDAVEKIFQHGIPDIMVEQKLQEIVSRAVELLPELYKQAGRYPDALNSYRRALLSQWNLDEECITRIQKRFAVFLLYSGVEATPPSLAYQSEGSFVPKNNLEEAILLLMILLRKTSRAKRDPAVLEHLTYALSLCGQTNVLAQGLEELPGELLRLAIGRISDGEKEYAQKICQFVRDLYRQLIVIVPLMDDHSDMKKKMEVMLQSVTKIENACFSVHVRGSEYIPLLGTDNPDFSFFGISDFEQ